MKNLSSIPNYNYLWGASGDNPYLGYLAIADDIIVTGDSVSMCSEASSTQKPVRIFTGSNWLTQKHLRFVNSLYNKQYATPLEQTNLTFTPNKTPLNTAQDIAKIISDL